MTLKRWFVLKRVLQTTDNSMKYMLQIYSPENAWTPEEWGDCVKTSLGICDELASKGQFLAAAPLHPVATATTVRVRNGQRLVTAGPFAETVEQLGGYYLIDVDNLDEAIAVASRLPPAKKGTIEIRPLFNIEGLPAEKLAPGSIEDRGLTRFMFLCYDDEEAWQAAGQQAHLSAMQEAVAITRKLDAEGKFISASPLHSSSTATCVRVRNGKRSITDGPYTETREVLGGYYLILASDRAEALEVAAKHPGVFVGAVEVREVFDVRTLGAS